MYTTGKGLKTQNVSNFDYKRLSKTAVVICRPLKNLTVAAIHFEAVILQNNLKCCSVEIQTN